MGEGSRDTKPRAPKARKARFTARSSPEWNEMTPKRPPRSRSSGAASSASCSAGISSLTAMRRAWNVRVATCVRCDQAGRGTPGLTLLPMLEEDAREFRLAEAGQKVGGGPTVARIEAHVEGLVVLEAEAAAGDLELIRRQPKVEEDGRSLSHAHLLRMRRDVAEAALPESDPPAEALQAPRRTPQSLGIAVEAEQAGALVAHFQQPLSVATHADRSVHHPAPASGAQEKRHFVQQHWEVRALPFHLLHTLVGQLRFDVLDGRTDLVALVVLEALAVPHLEALLHADDERLLGQALALTKIERDLDASLRIEDHVLRLRHVLVLESATEGIESRETPDAFGEVIEVALGMDVETAAPVGNNDELVSEPVGEQLTKPCGDAEPTLRIHRVPEMSPKHALPRRGENLSPNRTSLPLHGISSHLAVQSKG